MSERLAVDKEKETEIQMLAGEAHAEVAKAAVLSWKAKNVSTP